MKQYTYRLLMRPPAPGTVPREGLLEAADRESWQNGKHYWGSVTYNRELTKEEVEHYELEFQKRSEI